MQFYTVDMIVSDHQRSMYREDKSRSKLSSTLLGPDLCAFLSATMGMQACHDMLPLVLTPPAAPTTSELKKTKVHDMLGALLKLTSRKAPPGLLIDTEVEDEVDKITGEIPT